MKLTTKQVCAMWNIKERSLYKARAIQRLRPDLGHEIMAQRLSIDAAYRIATGKPQTTPWDRLVAAFLAASPEDKARFIAIMDQSANLQWPT